MEPQRLHIERIREIDHLLEGPIKTLLWTMGEAAKGAAHPIDLPRQLTEVGPRVDRDSRLLTAQAISLVQRLATAERRLPRVRKPLVKLAQRLGVTDGEIPEVPRALLEAYGFTCKEKDLPRCTALVSDGELGSFDPLTAAQLFWLQLWGGEDQAHSSAGFTAFFTLLWALSARKVDPFHAGGVALRHGPPTAFATASCLSPLLFLIKICRRRADLLDELRESVKRVDELLKATDAGAEPHADAALPLHLEGMITDLTNLAELATDRTALETAAKELEEIALAQTTRDAATGADKRLNAEEKWNLAHQRLLTAFEHLGTTGTELLTAVSGLLEELWQRRTSEVAKANPEEKEAFERARNDCRECLAHLLDGASALSTLGIAAAKGEEHGLQKLAKANRAVAHKIERLCNEPVRWCLGALTQEIAHASSGDMSALDAIELLSALLVAVKSRVVESPTVVSDAIEKALQAKLSDGGWINGRRLTTDAPLSCSAATAWTLARIVDEMPEVQVGDAALDEFVDWLKRRKVRLSTASGATVEPQGWTLEGRGRRDHIDLWVTVLSIQALIEIRTIHENRLGEICRERFKIVPAERKLEEIDPVDLALPHEMRLHHRLAKMARDILSRRRYSKAMYSLVLHGPPGSSKTAIAGALAKELLRFRPSDAAELIRITPADFTRQGEDNLDAEAARIFELLTHSRRVIVLFDEIDDLLRRREPFGTKRFFDLVVPAMLNRLQDLRDACRSQEIVFLLATNFIDTIEPALVRKGRVDDSIPLVYPDHRSRNFILRRNAESFRKKLELLRVGRTRRSDLFAAFLAPLEKIVADMGYEPWTSLNSFCEELVEVALQLIEEKPDITQSDFKKRIREGAEELSAQNPPQAKALTYRERLRGFEGLLGQEFIAYTLCGPTLKNIGAHRKEIKDILSQGDNGTKEKKKKKKKNKEEEKKEKELRAAGKALEPELKRFWGRRERGRSLTPASAPSPSGGRRRGR